MLITKRTEFSVIPEAGLTLGYQVSRCLRVNLGYNVLYWSNVVRPGEQIDTVLDTNQIPNFPGPATPAVVQRPRVPFNETNLWVQGITAGLEVRW
jgi:hypothetical protein